ncbi:protein-disulfide reductase DsbD domain-containing protein [Falsirhodobacter deserti]|uniref:protein-disulfide reductase DsbD domain-containing protein n=1 Tax=Falsirhodobacter deserti TaxID=1365611 RepID=UPI000FE305BF|nr:protein-disulfide reductase DsbD domain-containing protein [Falsirhodobacter deserti]
MLKMMIALLALPAMMQPAAAQDLPSDLVAARILPGWQTPDGTRMVALRLRLHEGWKTYWRSPGDAGIPPEFNWSGSSNLAGVRLHWPRPEVFHTNGLESIGYHRELVLPIELVPADPSRPVSLHAEVDLGVCRDVCVPATIEVAADLTGRGAHDAMIEAALADQPRRGTAHSVSCSIAPIKDGLRVTARMILPPQGKDEVVVIEAGDDDIWSSPAEVSRQGDTLIATSELVASDGRPFALDRSAMRLTVLGAGRAAEVLGCPAA